MQIIPVIDVRGGIAVRAVRGDRANYRPLETPLAARADPAAVASGLRTLFPFDTIYLADLDGIEGRGANLALQSRLAISWPGREIWIDDGSLNSENAKPRCHHVLGSESMLEAIQLHQDAILSLDFFGDAFQGPLALLENPALWPDRIIVMTLARVGSGEGPDLPRLREIISRAEGREIFAAGGVRNRDDLKALRGIGAAGALVATALHTGKIKTGDLEEIAG
ncbi:MAG: HisA/HisF-related TIM barrel protein [Hyphomicrobium sp.]|jgi:phosphoribosylformimino-5-aminoimidazole carboxamide ribotide isomerase